MDLQQLQAFDQIVQMGNFSKAARRLHISQPTISLRIQALEQAVGGELFIRGGKSLSLTELGRNFLPYARQALRAMTAGVEVAQQIAQGNKGRVVIGTLPSLATGFFASTIERLQRSHPQLDIVIHTGHSQQIIEMLHDGFIHAGFIVGPFFHPGLKTLLHIQEPLVLVTHTSHPLAHRNAITTSDLVTLANPFFSIDWNREVRHWQTQTMAASRTVIEVPPHTAHDLLIRGVGAALLTRSLISHDLRAGRLVVVAVEDIPGFQRESLLIRLDRAEPLPAAFDAFFGILREEARAFVSS